MPQATYIIEEETLQYTARHVSDSVKLLQVDTPLSLLNTTPRHISIDQLAAITRHYSSLQGFSNITKD
jgi:hypothetical protein